MTLEQTPTMDGSNKRVKRVGRNQTKAMAHIPTEQEGVVAHGVIVGGTDLDGSSISDMLTINDAAFGRNFHHFSPLREWSFNFKHYTELTCSQLLILMVLNVW